MVNVTNGTLTLAEKMKLKEDEDAKESSGGVEYLIPRKLVLRIPPNEESNETVPFSSQPQLVMYDVFDRWVQNLGTKLAPWVVTASIVKDSGDPNAMLMGNISVPFINGTTNFTNLAISHNGTEYKLLYSVTYPRNVSFSVIHGNHTIKERELRFAFFSNISDAYDGVEIMGLPSVTVYDKALGNKVQTGWKNRKWYLAVSLVHGANVNATILGIDVVNITDGFGSFTNVSIDKAGKNYQLKLSVYTIPASTYTAEYITPKFNVSKRIFTLVVAREAGDCNETVICGQQPIVQVRSILPDMLAGNLGYDGRKWYLNVSSCFRDNSQTLLGTTYIQIPKSGEVILHDLHFDQVSVNESLCFQVVCEPYDEEYSNLTTMSLPFVVKARQMLIVVEIDPRDANETVIFGQQPVIDVRDVGTLKSAYPLRKTWNVTVSLNKTFNGGILSGNKTVSVIGTHANFSNLAISSYGVGFVLKFESNYGHVVSDAIFIYQNCVASILSVIKGDNKFIDATLSSFV